MKCVHNSFLFYIMIFSLQEFSVTTSLKDLPGEEVCNDTKKRKTFQTNALRNLKYSWLTFQVLTQIDTISNSCVAEKFAANIYLVTTWRVCWEFFFIFFFFVSFYVICRPLQCLVAGCLEAWIIYITSYQIIYQGQMYHLGWRVLTYCPLQMVCLSENQISS